MEISFGAAEATRSNRKTCSAFETKLNFVVQWLFVRVGAAAVPASSVRSINLSGAHRTVAASDTRMRENIVIKPSKLTLYQSGAIASANAEKQIHFRFEFPLPNGSCPPRGPSKTI